MDRSKITIIGAGNVGGTIANWIVSKDLGDVVLVDIKEGIAKGKALDLLQATPMLNVDSKIIGTNDYKETKNSDIVVVAAGTTRKEGMSREDLVNTNLKIVFSVVKKAAEYSPNSILIIVTNPLDAMAYVAYKASKFPKERVVGMAGILDSVRFKLLIASELNVSVNDINAIVLGGHDATMIPMERLADVNGIPVKELISKEKIDQIIEKTRKAGGEFLPLLGTSAWVASGMAVCEMIESIVKDKKRILPCSAYLNGEYGAKDLFIGVPVVLGKNGIEKIIEIKLNDEEKKQFNKTVEQVKSVVSSIDFNKLK